VHNRNGVVLRKNKQERAQREEHQNMVVFGDEGQKLLKGFVEHEGDEQGEESYEERSYVKGLCQRENILRNNLRNRFRNINLSVFRFSSLLIHPPQARQTAR